MAGPGTDEPDVIDRNAGRVILIDPDDRVLLLACCDPGRPDAERWWITPGGGCEAGETYRHAAKREAEEELGFNDLKLGPCVWTRTATFPWLGRLIRQHERFFVCRTHRREPTADTRTADELMYLHGHRWWSPAQITAAIDDGTRFAPRRFDACLKQLLDDGPPTRPIDVGV